MIVSGILILLGILGVVAAHFSKIGHAGCALSVYYCLMIVLGFAALFIGGGLLYLRTQVSVDSTTNAVEKVSSVTKAIDTWFGNYIVVNPKNWIEMQNYLGCCGYVQNSNHAAATGEPCLSGAQPCRPKIYQNMHDSVLVIAAASFVVFAIVMLAWISSCCIWCCAFGPSVAESKRVVPARKG
jgi:hypothetical protein